MPIVVIVLGNVFSSLFTIIPRISPQFINNAFGKLVALFDNPNEIDDIFIQLLKLLAPIDVRLPFRPILLRLTQLLNTLDPMLVTVLGNILFSPLITMLYRFLQFVNNPSDNVINEGDVDNCKLVNLLQLLKQLLPIEVMIPYAINEVRLEQFIKASAPILVTVLGSTLSRPLILIFLRLLQFENIAGGSVIRGVDKLIRVDVKLIQL